MLPDISKNKILFASFLKVLLTLMPEREIKRRVHKKTKKPPEFTTLQLLF